MERDILIILPIVTIIISTHTLTWSVTSKLHSFANAYSHFNSHAHVERDFIAKKFKSKFLDFNSHAHVERDIRLLYKYSVMNYFNSHAHVERDFEALLFFLTGAISTHTLTWSVTLDVVYIWCLLNVMRTYFFI